MRLKTMRRTTPALALPLLWCAAPALAADQPTILSNGMNIVGVDP